MDTKWTGCISLSLLSLVVHVISQPGFLNLNCGGKTNSTQNGIRWVSDTNYIDVGQTADIEDASDNSYGSYLHTIRVFPNPMNKSCYELPIVRDVPHLLRLWFTLGSSSGYQQWPSFAYSIETLGLLRFKNVTFTDTRVYYDEYMLVSSGRVLYVCLIRTSDIDNPFINAIELRTLREGMYAAAKPGTILRLIRRRNVGGNSRIIRYPQDNFDRFWIPETPPSDKNLTVTVKTTHLISSNNTEDFPPNAVMQTAWVVNTNSETDGIRIPLGQSQGKTLVVMYFAQIKTLNPSESRSFYVQINDINRSSIITLVPKYSAMELTFTSSDYSTYDFTFAIRRATKSSLAPIINAYEYYWLFDTQPATYLQDVEALNVIKSKFHIKDWKSDPCYLIEWKGIRCDHNGSMGIRISEMNLSGRNLRGSIPEDIGQLTALVNLSLDNNHLMGSLPNFSNLTMLERLYLHNNNFSGSVPEWLSELKNLKVLFIENNKFSGVIPAQLFNEFLNSSLTLSYFGNPYLFKPLPNSKKSKVGVVLGITLSGILIISVVLLVGTVLYRKKFRRKEGVDPGQF